MAIFEAQATNSIVEEAVLAASDGGTEVPKIEGEAQRVAALLETGATITVLDASLSQDGQELIVRPCIKGRIPATRY